MRIAHKTKSGRWYLRIQEGDICHINPIDWSVDRSGHWPRVELVVRDLGDALTCPKCGKIWVFEEIDCVFGTGKRDGSDVLILDRCLDCKLPHRIRATGFINSYPQVVQRMEGWAGWEERKSEFDAEELKLYGR